MIGVTEEAKDLLYDALEQAERQAGIEDEELAIRLVPATPPGITDTEAVEVTLGIMLDHAQEGDQVVEHRGKKVLVIDQETSNLFDGTTLDAVDTPEGRRLEHRYSSAA